jgi:tRNA threonylcarbamoyladenosine biosynthesis protein TsaB
LIVLLALDTSTRTLGISLHDGSQVLAESIWVSVGHHTIELAPEVALMLRKVGGTIARLKALAIAIGPGSYTGLRIGMSLAKGLALTQNLPLIGIPTLDIVARSQPRRSEPMFVTIESGRKRIAGLWYKWGRKGWQAKGEAESMTWVELRERLSEKTYICGEISAEGRELLSSKSDVELAPPAQCVRRPSFLAELAWKELRSGRLSDPAKLSLIYLGARRD